jgi:hypothetical protein
MRELTLSETSLVGGALDLGTGTGGIFSGANVGAATRLIGGVGALYAAWQVGTAIGTAIYGSRGYQALLMKLS